MLHKSWVMFVRGDLPKLFEADAEFLRFAILPQPEALDQRFRQAAARTFGKQCIFAAQLHAAGESRFVMAVLADTHVAGSDPGDCAVFQQRLSCGKAGINLDTERFRFAREITADFTERDDEVAMIAHEWRHQSGR